jgi:flagellar motor switch protein FliG
MNFEKLLLSLSDRDIQKLMMDIDTDTLVGAIHCESKDVQTKIFNNMSIRASSILKEEMKVFSGMRSDEAQEKIISQIQKLDNFGEITVDPVIFHELEILLGDNPRIVLMRLLSLCKGSFEGFNPYLD